MGSLSEKLVPCDLTAGGATVRRVTYDPDKTRCHQVAVLQKAAGDTKLVSNQDSESESETESETETEPQRESESEPESQRKSESKPESECKSESKPESQ